MAGYGDDQGFTDWLTSQGLTLPTGAPPVAALRQRGADYVDATYEPMLHCSQRAAGWEQERAWPRVNHYVGLNPVEGVPMPWVSASYRAAWLEASSPGWATGTIDPNRRTKREKADVLEREFFSPSETGGDAAGVLGNVDAVINGMVAPLLCPTTGMMIAVV